MRNIFLLLVSVLCMAQCIVAQNAISVYSQGAVINHIAEANNKLYIGNYGKGVVVYDMPTGTYRTMDISNSPMASNVVYTVQTLGPDTQLIRNFSNTWLVINGLWSNINKSDSSTIALSDNGRIFQVSENGGPLMEFKNGMYQPVTDSAVAGYQFGTLVPQRNNELLMGIRDTGSLYLQASYQNGRWAVNSAIAGDSIWGANAISYQFTDDSDRTYALVTSNDINYHFYKRDSTVWTQLSFPFPNMASNETLHALLMLSDTAGNPMLFYDKVFNMVVHTSSGDGTYDSISSGVWFPLTQQLIQFPDSIFSRGISDQIYAYKDNYFIPDLFYGLQKWNKASNTFSPVNYSNINLLDYELGNQIQGNYKAVQRNDSLYMVDGFGYLYAVDTSLSNCRLLATTPRFSSSNEAICKDNHGNIWVLDDTHHTVNNVTTGGVMNLPDSNLTCLFVYDSAAWVGIIGSLELVINNSIQTTTYFTSQIAGMDKNGYMWGGMDSGNISRVARVDMNGNVDIVKSWDFGSYNYGDYPESAIDRQGNAWVLCNDSIIRYTGSQALTPFTIVKPHTSDLHYNYIGVFDSTEMVLINANTIEYYYNGQWSYYDAKFSPWHMVSTFSLPDHRLIFVTEEDGIIEYRLGGSFYNSGNHIGGIVFHDVNNNLAHDSADVPLINIPVTVNADLCSSNGYGHYGLDVANGSYTIKLQTPPYYVCSPDSFNVSINNSINDSLNFACYAPQQVNDLSLSINAYPFTFVYGGDLSISVRNNGTAVVAPVITITYDAALALNFSDAQVINQSTGSVTVQLNNLYPMEEHSSVFAFTGPEGIGDTVGWLHFKATAYPLAGDTTPQNNTDTATVMTLGSFDPNYKSVQPPGAGIFNSVDTNEALIYTIGFQNTGSAQAINITLVDTLDAALDFNTFKYVACSHANTFQLVGRVLTVTFKNINLPDSAASETASKGYFKFSIKPIHPVHVNQPVSNKAYIYFDFNPAIVTNNTKVAFGPVVYTSIASPAEDVAGGVMVWPQPCADELNIYLSQPIQLPGTLKLFDLAGKLIMEEQVTERHKKLQVSSFSSGVYILSVMDSGNRLYRFKCVKGK